MKPYFLESAAIEAGEKPSFDIIEEVLGGYGPYKRRLATLTNCTREEAEKIVRTLNSTPNS